MKKNYFYLIILLLILFLVESAMRSVFLGSRILPSLLLVFVVVLSAKRPVAQSLWFAFFAGLLLEIFSGTLFGSYIFAFEIVALSVFFITRKVTAQEVSMLSGALLVIASTILFVLGVYVYGQAFTIFGRPPGFGLKDFLNWQILWAVLLNIVCFYIIKFIFNILPKES